MVNITLKVYQQRDRLADDDQAERATQKADHWQQAHAGPVDLRAHERADDARGKVEAGDRDAQRDEQERDQLMHAIHPADDAPADKIQSGAGERRGRLRSGFMKLRSAR